MAQVDEGRATSLTGSEREWLRVRGYLREHRYDLSVTAADLYPELPRVGRTPLHTTRRCGKGWVGSGSAVARSPRGDATPAPGVQAEERACTPATGAALLRTPDRRRSRSGFVRNEFAATDDVASRSLRPGSNSSCGRVRLCSDDGPELPVIVGTLITWTIWRAPRQWCD